MNNHKFNVGDKVYMVKYLKWGKVEKSPSETLRRIISEKIKLTIQNININGDIPYYDVTYKDKYEKCRTSSVFETEIEPSEITNWKGEIHGID